jgi:hypothetical protein
VEIATDLQLGVQAQAKPLDDRGGDWPLATVFCSCVLAMYAALGYLVYGLV